MLVMLCKSIALARIVGTQEGLEAWRSVVEARDPSSLTRSAGLPPKLPRFSFDGDITARIVQYGHVVD